MRKKFKLREEIEKLVEKYKTLSPNELKKYILQDFNKDVTPESITVFFKRNPEVKTRLQTLLSESAVSQIEVSTDLFQNGNFQECASVKQWIIEKKTLVSPNYLNGMVTALKRICQGRYYTQDPITKAKTEHTIPDWTPKSPDRLTLEQFKVFEGIVQAQGCATNNYRMSFRDFWLSRTGKTLKPSEVSGVATTGTTHKLGRWKNCDVSKEKLNLIFEKLKEYDYQAFAACYTAYKTASRHSAVLTEYLESKLLIQDGQATIEITDKGFHRNGRLSFNKLISPDLLEVLRVCWKKYGNNPFAGLNDLGMMQKLKEIYREVLKDEFDLDGVTPKPFSSLELALSSPFHFWRHMFGRKMLEATKYNYTVVAALGSWSDEAMLHKVYGAAPMAMLKKAGFDYLPLI